MKSGDMKVYVIEDEPVARTSLVRMLTAGYPDIEVVGTAGSVKDAVSWLEFSGNRPDVIFMDVELSDGDCFEIFRQVRTDAAVIMTTAYENYAVKAFEVNSIDYLLKPISAQALDRAVERCRARQIRFDPEALVTAFRSRHEGRKRFIVRFNDNIVPVPVTDVAYFYAAEKNTWLVTSDGTNYAMDQSLDIISEELDGSRFFRISRNCIISMDAIGSITRQFGGRLCISARPASPFEMTVSRSRTEEFLRWLEG